MLRLTQEQLREELRKTLSEKRFKGNCTFSMGQCQDIFVKGGCYGEGLKHEHDIGSFLHEHGVQVPEMYGVFSEVSEFGDRHFLVMQRIMGKELTCFSVTEREGIVKQFQKEVKKVIALGVIPVDSFFLRNSIFGDDGKLYLIDFDGFQKEGPARELSRYSGMLENCEQHFYPKPFYYSVR